MSSRIVLDETYRLLSKGWIQGNSACRQDGEVVSFADPSAAAFCLLGALFRAGLNTGALKDRKTVAFETAKRALLTASHKPYLWSFNDDKTTTRERVLALVDRVRNAA